MYSSAWPVLGRARGELAKSAFSPHSRLSCACSLSQKCFPGVSDPPVTLAWQCAPLHTLNRSRLWPRRLCTSSTTLTAVQDLQSSLKLIVLDSIQIQGCSGNAIRVGHTCSRGSRDSDSARSHASVSQEETVDTIQAFLDAAATAQEVMRTWRWRALCMHQNTM